MLISKIKDTSEFHSEFKEDLQEIYIIYTCMRRRGGVTNRVLILL